MSKSSSARAWWTTPPIQGSPAALALLSGIACLGTPHQAAKAERAALALMELGVAMPAWAEHLGAVQAGRLLRHL